MNEMKLKVTKVDPTRDERIYTLYDFKTKEMIDCYDSTPQYPIYLTQHPQTKEPLYFKFIPEYNYHYGITKEGIIISFKSRHINTVLNPNYPLKVRIKKDGKSGNKILYKTTLLSINGDRYLEYIHKLVLETWVGNPPKLNPDGSIMLTPPECNHKDLDVNNNDYTNLEWCDRYYNNSHRVASEEWSFEHTPEYNQKQLVKLRNLLENLREENEELLSKITPQNEEKFYKNQMKIDSLEYQINELEYHLFCQLSSKYEGKEVV